MKVDVIGYCNLDFSDKEGKKIQGTNIFYLEDISSAYGKGKKACKKFIKPEVDISALHIGVNSFETDLKGNIVEVH